MKLVRLPLLCLLLFCATQAFNVTIYSTPEVNSDDVIEAELNETVSLVCQLGGGHDPQEGEELVWLRNEAVVRLQDGNKEGHSSVCITPITYEDNAATFTCHLKKNATTSASVTLNVTYGPQLSGSEQVLVEEEAELHLQCDIQANPPVSTVTWMQNGNQVDLEAGGFMVTNDGFKSQLSANKVARHFHEGTYQCLANSPAYGIFSKLFFVTLTDKTIKFPMMPMIAGLVVVGLTMLLAIIARWKTITKCFKSLSLKD